MNDLLKRLNRGDAVTMNRAERRNAARMIKDEMRRIENIRAADRMSGAGYPVDQQLREWLDMCNKELLAGAAEPPYAKLWDVIGAFYRWEPHALGNLLRVKVERDHAFLSTDFFGFATDPDLREQRIAALEELPEGVIHNYSVKNDLKDVLFQVDQKPVLAMSGISFIRFGNHLFWLMSIGQVDDLGAITADRRAIMMKQAEVIRRNNPNTDPALLDDILKPEAVSLAGAADIWKTPALGLFNLETRAHEIRMTVRDWKVSEAVFSDQFEQKYAELYEKDEAVRRMVDKAMDQIERDHLYFEIAETAFLLPAYFRAKVQFIATDSRTTALGDPSRGADRKHALKAPPDMRIQTRQVSTLEIYRAGDVSRTYSPPRFRVEIEGYWRRLSPEAVGRDATGAPVLGRTWVHAHARWKEKPPKIGVIHVKTPLGHAIQRAEALAAKHGGSFDVVLSPRKTT